MEMEQRGIIIQLIHMSTVKAGGAHGKQQTIQDTQTNRLDSLQKGESEQRQCRD
jgi:hypothetical protein